MRLLIFLLLFCSFNVFAFPEKPDQNFTPGHFCTIGDPDFKEFRYAENIPYCERNVSYSQRTAIYVKYNVPLAERGDYTIDHLIPLSLGGSNSELNLWPQHKILYTGNLEYQVYKLLRDGKITQKEAINVVLSLKLKKSYMAF